MSEGWAPAVLNTNQEMNFIKQGQRSFMDNRSFWIGGKTNTVPGEYFEYSAYNAEIFSSNEFDVSENTGMS